MTRLRTLAFSLTAFVSLAEWRSAQGNVLVVDDGPDRYGGAYLLDLNSDGTLDSLSEVPVPVEVSDFDQFGSSVATLGDLDGNGTPDLIVGTPFDDRAGVDRGALWILFRESDGSVSSRRALRPGRDFEWEPPPDAKEFGRSLAPLGDLDGDGSLELAVGASLSPGSVWILSLEPDGSVSREVVIGEGVGGFAGDLDLGDAFGASLAALGDLDGDGNMELAVGAFGDDDGASGAGAVWILDLETDGTVQSESKISNLSGAFGGVLDLNDFFGSEVSAIGDVDGDGTTDIAVGTPEDDDGGLGSGAVWVLTLAPDGSVESEQKISKTSGGLGDHPQGKFGAAVAPIGDRNSDGVPDLAVGATSDASPFNTTGAVFVLFLNADGTVQSSQVLTTEFTGITTGDALGTSLAALGDWDLDGRPDLAVGAKFRDGSVPAPDFATFTAALSAAAAGDTILVRAGIYSLGGTSLIQSKSLTIQAANPLNVSLSGTLEIANLSASQSVRLSGLILRSVSFPQTEDPALDLQNDLGVVWVDDCLFPAITFGAISPGVRVSACAKVVLNRCSVNGFNSSAHDDFDVNVPAPPAISLGGGSAVHAYDCTITGAAGACFVDGLGDFHGQVGGPGIVSSASDFLFLSGCEVRGGTGTSCVCRAGGKGLQVTGPAKVLDSTVAGGVGCPNGAASSGPVTFLAGERLAMAIDNPKRESEDTLFYFEGPPEAAVFVLYSLTPGALYRPALLGTDVLGSQRVMAFLGRTDAQGKLRTYGQQNDPPPGFDVLRVFAQALYVQPSTAIWTTKTSPAPRPIRLGSGQMITRLDSAF